VIPQRPAGSDSLDEAGLADLVTRDSMIGTGLAMLPGSLPAVAHAGASA
jgi:nitrile hydratase